MLLTEPLLSADTVLGAGTGQRDADVVSVLGSSRLVRAVDSEVNATLVRTPDGAVLREQITKLLNPDHGCWRKTVEGTLTKRTRNGILDRGNSTGGGFVGGESPGHFGSPKVASVAGTQVQGESSGERRRTLTAYLVSSLEYLGQLLRKTADGESAAESSSPSPAT